jgi:hypothetical protein
MKISGTSDTRESTWPELKFRWRPKPREATYFEGGTYSTLVPMVVKKF